MKILSTMSSSELPILLNKQVTALHSRAAATERNCSRPIMPRMHCLMHPGHAR